MVNQKQHESIQETIKEGTLLWEADQKFKDEANITKYLDWLKDNRNKQFIDYNELWQWSVDEVEEFWQTIWNYFKVESPTPYTTVLENRKMPGAKWFSGSTINFTQQILRDFTSEKVAIFAESETRSPQEITWGQMTKDVLILATQLRKMGVKPGDRVGAYIPNIPEAIVALLATASIGAVWSSCSPDFGTKSVLDRFEQIQPKVLFVVDGYQYGGNSFDLSENLVTLSNELPTVEHLIHIPYLFNKIETSPVEGSLLWDEVLHQEEVALDDFIFEPTPFEHPLWILYSSGTTGIPKGIVHSHGGIILEMYKGNNFHLNLNENSRLFFYTTTGWMMFNVLVSGLITKSSIVLYDGNPVYPDAGTLWKVAERTGTTMFGSSPSFVQIMKKVGISPKDAYDLSKLEGILISGSPAGPEVFEWMYKYVKNDFWLASLSGGTDVATGFVGSLPTEPVRAAEMQVRALGVDARAYNEAGDSVIDEVGELVIAKPMPSMPIYYWNDPDNKRYFESYFDVYPDVWRHGDYIKITNRGSALIYGRSDSTLNRFGVRMGTSEIYSSVEIIEEIKDSLIVNLDLPAGKFFMPLFVVLKDGFVLDDELKKKILNQIRSSCSPRHVPDEIYQIEEVPYTLTTKKMEVPVRNILLGGDEKKVANRDAMMNPISLDYFIKFRNEVVSKK